ncbi:MAG: tetratricopeptide repeat protein [Myxococcota bacterium]
MNDSSTPAPASECIGDATYADVLAGVIDDVRFAAVRSHAAGCDACRELLAAAGRVRLHEERADGEADTIEGNAARAETGAAGLAINPDQPGVGSTFGRYTLSRVLGAGGMGVVYAARDRELKREVAVKFLHRTPLGSEASTRLLREARAMATVQHPNVVAVYDTGVHDGHMFVVMDLVRGGDLKAWLADGERPWRAVVQIWLDAARGLAAVHAAGLVHRDFKPANVLIHPDGHALVTDFGLVRVLAQVETLSESAGLSGGLAESRTKTGTVMGTPRYMSPEQLHGRAADARSDQFSFCVSLWEALFDVHPFGEGEWTDRHQQMKQGVVDPPSNHRVPAAVVAALRRGLALEVEGRHRSMEALSDALRSACGSRRAGKAVTVAAVGATLAVGVALARPATSLAEEPCRAAAPQLATVWNDGQRDAVHRALLDSGAPYAESTWLRVDANLARFGRAWVVARNEACEATQRGTQAESALDLRMGCYDRRLSALAAFVDAMKTADDAVVRQAAAASADLPAVDGCAAVEALRAGHEPLADDQARAAAAAASAKLDRAATVHSATNLELARVHAGEVIDEAERLGHVPLRVRALQVRAGLLETAGEFEPAAADYERAFELAVARRLDTSAARAAASLIGVYGGRLRDFGQASKWQRHAEALLAVAPDPRASLYLQGNAAVVSMHAGDLGGAQEFAEEALAVAVESLGETHPETAAAHVQLGGIVAQRGEMDAGWAHLNSALAALETSVGPNHPDLAGVLNNMASFARKSGKPDEAHAYGLRALAIAEPALGTDARLVATILANLAHIQRRRGELAEARDYGTRALAAFEAAPGIVAYEVADARNVLGAIAWSEGDDDVAGTHFLRAVQALESAPAHAGAPLMLAIKRLGDVARVQSRFEDARGLYERALEIETENSVRATTNRTAAINNLGMTLQALGDYEAARQRHAEALAIRERTLPPEHPTRAYSLTGLGTALVDLDRIEEARPLLERALTLRLKSHATAEITARTRFALARALWAAGSDRERALTLARAASVVLAAGGPRHAFDAAAVADWLEMVDPG